MVCSMVKKAVVGTALGAGALFLVFGTHAPGKGGLVQGTALFSEAQQLLERQRAGQTPGVGRKYM